MTTKLDMPKTKGDLTYSNRGSASRIINYQISNKEKLGDDNAFFTLSEDKITPTQAKNLIDNNVKGLKATDEKFYSFSINPSDAELKHIGNDKTKLKEFTRTVMANYAENFSEKGLSNKDLVWTAIIHDTRYYTHEDVLKAKQSGVAVNFSVGEKKPGNNTHIHVIVSRKTADMKKTLTIRGRKGKTNFSLFSYQKKNQETFQNIFQYRVGENVYGELQTKSILERLKTLEGKMKLSEKEVLKIAEKHNFSGEINYNIKSLEKSLNRGEVINDPYKYIELGKKEYFKQQAAEEKYQNTSVTDDFLSVIGMGGTMEKNRGEIPDISEYNKRRKKKRKFII